MVPALPLKDQRFMALEGFLTWVRAVLVQADRVSSAQDAIITQMRARTGPEMRAMIHAFQAERHLFCVAAAKMLEHRRWIGDLDRVDSSVFAELDQFEADVQEMRNLNEHAIEYFRGKGRFPAKWDEQMKAYNSDPTGTQDSLIGGRLDWCALRAAVMNLMESFPNWNIREGD
ncbi:hypothetical protein ACWAUC_18890 [Bradyrhizobium guangdongense]